jgi:hypothetical protein
VLSALISGTKGHAFHHPETNEIRQGGKKTVFRPEFSPEISITSYNGKSLLITEHMESVRELQTTSTPRAENAHLLTK